MKILKYIIAFVILGFLCWYLSGHWQQLAEITHFAAYQVVGMYVLCGVSTLVSAITVQIILKSFRKTTGMLEMFHLSNAVSLLNYAPMKAGTLFRGVYLNKHYGLGYSHFASFFVYMTILTGASASLLAAAAMFVCLNLSEPKIKITTLFFAAAAVVLGLILFLPLPTPKGQNKWLVFWGRFLDGKKLISSNPAAVVKAGLLMMVFSLLTAVRLGVIYAGINQSVNPAGLLVFGALDCLSLFISFTPGSLGLRELLFSAGAAGLGISLEVGMFAAMIDRAVLVIYAFTAGAASTLILWRKTPSDFKEMPLKSESLQ